MLIKRVVVGYLEENCYIVSKDNKVIIIDPGDEFDKIVSNIDGYVVGVLITHHHFDHVGALNDVINKYGVKENDLPIKDFDIEVIKTPGHKEDCLTFYFKDDNVMFTGDFLFKDSVGRMDFPGGSVSDMKKSIDIISKYNKDIVIYPGHGDSSILGIEVNNAKELLN